MRTGAHRRRERRRRSPRRPPSRGGPVPDDLVEGHARAADPGDVHGHLELVVEERGGEVAQRRRRHDDMGPVLLHMVEARPAEDIAAIRAASSSSCERRSPRARTCRARRGDPAGPDERRPAPGLECQALKRGSRGSSPPPPGGGPTRELMLASSPSAAARRRPLELAPGSGSPARSPRRPSRKPPRPGRPRTTFRARTRIERRAAGAHQIEPPGSSAVTVNPGMSRVSSRSSAGVPARTGKVP